MAIRVREIMNEELYAIGPEATVAETASAFVALEITSAPVVDAERKPRGLVTLRELLGAPPERQAASCARANVATVRGEDAIANAAKTMARTGQQLLVVLDEDGRAAGAVSAIDVVRALVGEPVSHPRAFPHFDAATAAIWSDDAPLDLVHAAEAPNGPGVLLLVTGGAGKIERVTWAEACENVRGRIYALLEHPPREAPMLSRALLSGHLRFRSSAIADPGERERVLRVALGRAMAVLGPHEPGAA